MVLQAVLTLRMSNTAFEDEGLYLYVGHLEIRHFLHGAALQGDYPSYFSGAPVLYPVLGALADSIGGLAAARALSLLEMLAVTGLIYAMSRRLFNERVALCAAIGFAVTEPALFLGHLATYDATALFLLTLADLAGGAVRGQRPPAVPARRAGAGARGRHQVRDAAVRAERHRAGRAGRRPGSAARR